LTHSAGLDVTASRSLPEIARISPSRVDSLGPILLCYTEAFRQIDNDPFDEIHLVPKQTLRQYSWVEIE
jgi:hypothetical protein